MVPKETTMKLGRIAPALLVVSVLVAPAIAADCDADRARFPKNWKDVAAETQVLTCRGHCIKLKVFLTPRPESGKQQKGLYILYSEKTCFIRGNYSSPAVVSFADDPDVEQLQLSVRRQLA
jgi:hypothetical protein